MFYKKFSHKITGLCIALIFSFVPNAYTQRNSTLAGGSPDMNYSRVLLKRPDVQRELGLNPQQKDALAILLNQSPGQIAARAIGFMPPVKYVDLTKLSNEERRQWQAEIGRQAAEQAAKFMNERRREVEAVLRPDQRRRLTEIDLQWRGILALVNQNLSDRLKISPEHYKSIAEIVADFEVKRLSLLNDSKNEDSPLYQKRLNLFRETEEKVLAILSDEEKARWAQAIGSPFNFQK